MLECLQYNVYPVSAPCSKYAVRTMIIAGATTLQKEKKAVWPWRLASSNQKNILSSYRNVLLYLENFM